jgi:hypothetical protein
VILFCSPGVLSGLDCLSNVADPTVIPLDDGQTLTLPELAKRVEAAYRARGVLEFQAELWRSWPNGHLPAGASPTHYRAEVRTATGELETKVWDVPTGRLVAVFEVRDGVLVREEEEPDADDCLFGSLQWPWGDVFPKAGTSFLAICSQRIADGRYLGKEVVDGETCYKIAWKENLESSVYPHYVWAQVFCISTRTLLIQERINRRQYEYGGNQQPWISMVVRDRYRYRLTTPLTKGDSDATQVPGADN